MNYENGDEMAGRPVWGNLGEGGKPPQRAHHLEKIVSGVSRERKKLKALELKKKNGFADARKERAYHKATQVLEPLMVVVLDDGTRLSLF